MKTEDIFKILFLTTLTALFLSVALKETEMAATSGIACFFSIIGWVVSPYN